MADLSSTIDIIFRGIDQASDTAKSVSSGISDMASAAEDVTAPFADMAEQLAVVQAVLIAVAGTMGTLAYKESVEFESSLLDLQKAMDETEGSARDFSAGIEDLGVKYGTNANGLVKSTADFRAAGYDLDTSMKLVEQSLQLVIAGGVKTEAAVSIMNKSLAGFSIPAQDVVKEAQHIGDTLNKTADLTKSSFTELANGFADLSPIAKQSGLSFEETAALLSKVIDVFGSGSEAANGLKSGFLSLVDPSKESSRALAELGIKFNDAGKPMGSVKDILAKLAPAFNELDSSQKLAAASVIFGKEQAGKMVAVLSQYNEAMSLAGKVTAEAAGSIAKEVDIRLSSAEAKINSTNEVWRQFLRALGDQFSINTTGVISGLGELGASFKKVIESGGLDPLFALLNPQLAALENLLRDVAANLPDAFEGVNFDGLVQAFENLGTEARKALEALFGPIDITSLEGLRQTIQSVVDVLSWITNVSAGELGGSAPFLAGVRDLVIAFKDAEPAAQGFLGTLIGLAAGVNKVAGFFEPLNTALLTYIAFGGQVSGGISFMRAEFAALQAVLAGGGIAAALGQAGIAGAVGTLAFSITKLTGLDKTLNDFLANDFFAGYEGATLGTIAADAVAGLGLRVTYVGQEADKAQFKLEQMLEAAKTVPVTQWDGAISAIARFEAELENNKNNYESYFNIVAKPIPVTQWDGMISKLDELAGTTNKAKAATIEWIDKLKDLPKIKTELPEGVKKTTSVLTEGSTAVGKYSVALGGVSTVYTQTTKETIKASGAFAAATDKTKEAKGALEGLTEGGKLTVAQLIEVTKTANDFEVKMEQIASNERIKNIEAAVSIKTTQLETDAERVKATFASIDNTITSTGDLLASLFGVFASADTYARLEIQEQIDLENRRRQEALDIQKKLAEAEIERIQAQTASLNRGDALINIEGSGLKPELEAFMWKILSLIRVRANAEFSQYLLGVGAG